MLSPSQMHMWSALEEGDTAAVHGFLDEGCSVREKNRFGWAAIHRACMGGSLECTALVLQRMEAQLRSEMVCQADSEGNTPLHMAAGCGHASVVSLLLKAGAVVDAPKKDGEGELKEGGATPMHTACKALAAVSEPALQERLIEVILTLLRCGGLLEAKDARGTMAAAFLPPPLQRRLLERVKALA